MQYKLLLYIIVTLGYLYPWNLYNRMLINNTKKTNSNNKCKTPHLSFTHCSCGPCRWKNITIRCRHRQGCYTLYLLKNVKNHCLPAPPAVAAIVDVDLIMVHS